MNRTASPRGRVRPPRLISCVTISARSLATFDPGPGRLTAAQTAKKYRVDLKGLVKAIDDEVLPGGERVELDRVLGKQSAIRTVDERRFVEYMASRPECAKDGCHKPAAIGSEACSGPHTRALETKGTKLSAETRRRMSEAQTERHRKADEALHRLNADGDRNLRQVAAECRVAPNTVSRWVAEGFLRAEPQTLLRPLLVVSQEELMRFNAEEWPRIVRQVGSRRLPHWKPLSQQRWSGRANGPKGAPQRSYSPLQAKAVRRLHEEGLGYKRLSKRTGLSVQVIRDILSEPERIVKLCECGCGQPAPIATGTDRRHGAVKGRPVRFIRGHNSRGGRTPPSRVF